MSGYVCERIVTREAREFGIEIDQILIHDARQQIARDGGRVTGDPVITWAPLRFDRRGDELWEECPEGEATDYRWRAEFPVEVKDGQP